MNLVLAQKKYGNREKLYENMIIVPWTVEIIL